MNHDGPVFYQLSFILSETGKDLGGAFKQLGKSLVKSGATVVNKANDWAERDDAKEVENSLRSKGFSLC